MHNLFKELGLEYCLIFSNIAYQMLQNSQCFHRHHKNLQIIFNLCQNKKTQDKTIIVSNHVSWCRNKEISQKIPP